MAIAADISVAINGDIREVGGVDNYRTLELHRFLQDLADDQEASGDDLVDITTANPSTRFTDQIIQLNNGHNVDDTLSQRFYAGSLEQEDGDKLYGSLLILGSVNDDATQIEIVQDGTILTSFWGTQATGGYNGDSASGILAQFLVPVRVNGADIDGRRARVQSRFFGDSYSFFNVQFGTGITVAALQTVNDAQNDTASGTVASYTNVTNTEGYQLIDIGDINGNQPYYSQWTFGGDDQGDGLKSVWEWGKYIQRQGTAETVHGIGGGVFLGITHSYDYDAGAAFTEDETVVWGTDITYDNLSGGTFTEGNYVTIGVLGAAGKIVYDNGTVNTIVALEDTSITLVDGDVITEFDTGTGATGVSADINVTITDNDKQGGEGLLLAATGTTTGEHYIQLLSGVAPVDNLAIRGLTSTSTALVNLAPSSKTVPAVFLGSYVGNLIGAYGIGVLPADLSASDTVTDLDGDVNTPPNNVTFTVFGLISGDRVLVTPEDGASGLDYDFLTLDTDLTTGTETAVVCSASIPIDTPATGTIRVQNDDGVNVYQAYTSYATATFTIASSDYSVVNATAPRNVFASYIDVATGSTSEAFTTIYDSTRTLFVRVRDGGATPIKPFETTGTLGNAGGSATAIRTSDA